MTLTEFIGNCLDQNYNGVRRSLDGLTSEELAFRPAPQCNSIGWTAWHYSRLLDFWINTIVKGQPQMWEQGWADKFNRPAEAMDVGFAHTPEQIAAFEAPDPEVLTGYLEASRGLLVQFLGEQDDDSLSSTEVTNPGAGMMPLSTLFQQLIWELNQHSGHIAYLRGIQRGIEDATFTGGVIGPDASA
jgi:hypothetical protein